MPRASTKAELLQSAEENYQKLLSLIASLSEKELATPFAFPADDKHKEAHWQRDKNLRDVLIHLYEWHRLVINWVENNRKGKNSPFFPAPYNWKSYGELNLVFWQNHQSTSLAEAQSLLQASHREILALIESLDEDTLFQKKAFPWVGTSSLGSYFVSATASHYEWAMKKLKAHQKNCKA